jgi:periplasmic protein TonB
MLHSFVRQPWMAAAAVATLLAVGPFTSTAEAQDKVYAIAELQTPPKLRSTADAGRFISESYPEELKRRGQGGMVEVQFVVDEKGKVDPASVEVLDATHSQLGEAAKKVAPRLEFQPGKAGGAAVKSKVVLPIIYKPN